jgi:KEOPS complex subunit Pcc1
VNLSAEFNFKLKNAPLIYKSILPELEDHTRSHTTLHHTSTTLTLQIQAEDITSLRAALNTWLRLIKIACELSNPTF